MRMEDSGFTAMRAGAGLGAVSLDAVGSGEGRAVLGDTEAIQLAQFGGLGYGGGGGAGGGMPAGGLGGLGLGMHSVQRYTRATESRSKHD